MNNEYRNLLFSLATCIIRKSTFSTKKTFNLTPNFRYKLESNKNRTETGGFNKISNTYPWNVSKINHRSEWKRSNRSEDVVRETSKKNRYVSADLLEIDDDYRNGRKYRKNEKNMFNDKREFDNKSREKWSNTKFFSQPSVRGEIVFGIHPVILALKAKRRFFHKLLLRKKPDGERLNDRLQEIKTLAESIQLPIDYVSRKSLDLLAGQRSHQSVCLDADPLQNPFYTPTEDEAIRTKNLFPVWLLLHQIHDPMNLGAIIRTAYFMGVDKILTIENDSCPPTPVVSKASSGGLEIFPVFVISSLHEFIKHKEKSGWDIIGTITCQGNDYNDKRCISAGNYSLSRPTIIVMGNEGDGVKSELLEYCTKYLSISSGKQDENEIKSLNVSVATEYEILIVRSGTKVTKEVLNVAHKLLIVGRAGTGVDNIDVDTATRKGICVMNVPGGNTISAAEHTCAMILTMTREIPQACTSLKSGKWDRQAFMGNELKGKTLAIVGLGRVGREVASRMQAFGMKTIGYDPIETVESATKYGVQLMTLEELWPQSDFVTLHVPLDAQTKHMINNDVFAKCKQGVRMVNVARGGIIDETSLLQALQFNKCLGAALDVFDEEPPKNTSLIQHQKVICTPHLGASTHEAQIEVAKQMAWQIVEYVKNKTMIGVVNAPITKVMTLKNQPWIDLARGLGQLLAALVLKIGKKEFFVNVTLYGLQVEPLTELVRAATLTGIMSYQLNERCTIINSPILAQEHNVKISVDVATSVPDYLGFDEGMLMGINDGQHSQSLIGFIRQRLAVLHSINSSVFENPVPLTHRLLIYSKTRTPDVAHVLSGLIKNKIMVNAVYCSKPNNDWFVACTSSEKKEESSENLSPSVDTFLYS